MRYCPVATALIALMILSPAWAQADVTLATPSEAPWIERPVEADFARAYPRGALQRNVSGEVALECEIDRDGWLMNCDILSETPAAEGFGDAAIKVSRAFRMARQLPDGTLTQGGRVRIPIRFFPR